MVAGMKNGDIHDADYHANLIYNAGQGTARELRETIDLLKACSPLRTRRTVAHSGASPARRRQ